jgi:addiction module HigA family antidote
MSKTLKPVHPGEILKEEFMAPLNLSKNKLALDLRVPVTRISEIVRERRSISPETALRLARYFKTTPEFWMNLQTQYDLETTEDRALQTIQRDVRPVAAAALAPSRAPAYPAAHGRKHKQSARASTRQTGRSQRRQS